MASRRLTDDKEVGDKRGDGDDDELAEKAVVWPWRAQPTRATRRALDVRVMMAMKLM
jgi:hypothetical protein